MANSGTITLLNNLGGIFGGQGGAGVIAGGAGGAGVANSGTMLLTNNLGGSISGGDGGSGASHYGAGGAGVANAGAMTALNNYAVVEGGRGSTFGAISQGGDGVTNTGTITGLNNLGAGEILGGPEALGAASGFGVSNFGTITMLNNYGHITGFAGIYNTNKIGVINNFATGYIFGSYAGIWNVGDMLVINNSAGGVIDPSGGGYAILSTGSIGSITNGGKISGNVEIDNQESLSVFGGTGKTFGEWTGGTITIGSGDLTFARGNTALGDDIVVDKGRGTVFNNDPLMIATPLTITGNFKQSSSGALDFGLAGDTAGEYGALDITGVASLDGVLGLDLLKGFKLDAGDAFDLLTYRDFEGAFSGVSVDGAACSATGRDQWLCNVGFYIDLGVGPDGVEVSIAGVPEPSTWTMLAAGFLGLAGLGLRRGGWRRPWPTP